MASDWIKLHRQSLDSQVFSDPVTWRLFCWCLLRANWKDGWFGGEKILAGSFVAGRDTSAAELKMSSSAWYRGMKKLQKFGLISLKANNRFTVVSVVKWSFFQDREQRVNSDRTADEQPADSQRTTGEQQADTIEERKDIQEGQKFKKERTAASVAVSVFFEQWWVHYPRKVAKDNAAKAYAKAIKSIGGDLTEAAALLLEASLPRLSEISKREQQYIPHAATWLNAGGWKDELNSITPSGPKSNPGVDYDPNHDYYAEGAF